MRRIIAAALLAVGLVTTPAQAADPLPPPIATLSLGAKAHGLHLVGTLLYVATETGMVVVDVATPGAPAVAGRVLPATSGLRSEAVLVHGAYAYLASPAGGLIVVDLATLKVVSTRRVSGGLWDLAVKDHVIYAVSFAGEMYLFDVEGPVKAKTPVLLKTLGLPAWVHPGLDPANIARLESQVTVGNAKATGVSVAGDFVLAVDWAYGRLYVWDATDPEQPFFAGTHYAPYLLKAVADVDRDVVVMLSAFGRTSGIYTVPLSLVTSMGSTRHATCAECGYLPSLFAVDQGGLAAVPGGRRIVWAGGKGLGELHVVNVETPTAMVDELSDDIGSHAVALAGTFGLAASNDVLFVTAGLLGLRVYDIPGLSP
jgi:hypothetical protein